MNKIAEEVYNVIKEVARLEEIDLKEALDKVVSYIAINGLYGSEMSVSFKTETALYLDRNLNIKELSDSRIDFLGDCYYIIYNEKLLLNDNVIYDNIKIDITESENRFPKTIFLKNVGTGSEGIKLVENASNGMIIYGVSFDIIKYRIAVLNTRLFNLPMFTLYIEPGCAYKDEIDIGTNSQNWTYANRWVPTKTSLLNRR